MDTKTIVITGGTGGIGTAMAKRMAKAGHQIVLTALNEEEEKKAGTILQDIQKDTQCEGMVVVTDVTQYLDCEALMQKAAERFGGIDVLVNNAGVFKPMQDFATMEISQIDSTVAVDLLGVMYGTRAVLPYMLKAGKGCIVSTASVAGLMSSPGYADYSACKAGVIGFTRSIAGEYAEKGIRCNAIAPGLIDTPMIDHVKNEMGEEELAKKQGIPLGRLGTAEDIADCLAYIVQAEYLTGQTVSPNGGLVMN